MKSINQDKWLQSKEKLTQENLGILRQLEDDTMLLAMRRGEFSKDELWFLQDEQGEEYVVFPQKLFVRLLSRIKSMQEEKLVMKLEKDIISQMPIDLDDAMAVATNILESLRLKDGNLPEINTAILAKDIRKKHPNLFFDIDCLRKSR